MLGRARLSVSRCQRRVRELKTAGIICVPEVVEAQRLFGEPDYLIRVVSADLPSYQQLYESVLIHLPGVRSLSSTIVMKQAVHPRPLPGRPPRGVTQRS